MKKILLTGAAGFIGFHVSRKLLGMGCQVIGLDNLNDYYDPRLKYDRLEILKQETQFSFVRLDVSDASSLKDLFAAEKPDGVVHLAAQAGVRYSLTHPEAYLKSNIDGFLNIIESCRKYPVEHLVYASSSSVYGSNKKLPFSTDDTVDHPVSLYAATKKSNELMAHVYSHLFQIPTSGLRFFTVYGPWGRPDMAMFIFAKAISEGRPIDVFNYGKMRRDFTYIDDIVEGVVKVLFHTAAPDPAWNASLPRPSRSQAPYRVYNIGNHQSVELLHLIELIEQGIGRKAEKKLLPLQPGDVAETFADVEDLQNTVGFAPSTPIEVGVSRFIDWYKNYFPRQND